MKFTKLALTLGISGLALFAFSGNARAVEVTHKVEFGETLTGISLKYFGNQNRFEEIAKANNIENSDLIFEGETLKIDTETGEIAKETVPEETVEPAVELSEEQAEVAEVHIPEVIVEPTPVPEIPVYTSGSVQDIVRTAAAARGWDTGANWNAIDFIVQHESSWNPTAKNPTSTAYGLFQMLVETNSNPAVQAENGMNYIANRYGTPTNALAFWQSHRWY